MRPAQTRTDLVTALLFGGLAVALLLSAVGKAREKAARALCESQLARIGKSVRLPGKKTDHLIVYALVSRAGGEVLSVSDY